MTNNSHGNKQKEQKGDQNIMMTLSLKYSQWRTKSYSMANIDKFMHRIYHFEEKKILEESQGT